MPGKSSRILVWVALTAACGGVPLTAPGGAVLQITATPLAIPAVDGESQVTVIASKSPEDGGGPVADGTQIFFTTPVGIIEERVETRSGIARATLRSDGRAGEASIVASSGAGASVTLNPPVTIGVSDVTRILLVAIPPTARAPDFTSDIVATVFDARGVPLRDVPLVFSTTAGQLASAGSVLRTDAQGRATDRLALGSERLARVTARAGAVTSTPVTIVRENASGVIVTGVSPSSGNPGQTLQATVSGSGFENGAQVTFSGGVSVTVLSITPTAIQIEIDIDDGAAQGPRSVTVTNGSGGSDTLPGGFTVGGGGPTITGIDPEAGERGDTIEATVEGTNFRSGAQVTIEDISNINETRVQATSITIRFTVPSGATPGPRDVTVRNQDGGSATLTDGFTIELPPPTITNVSPAFGSAFGPATLTVTITGTNFAAGVTADFGAGIDVDVIESTVTATTFQVELDIDDAAPQTMRDVTVTVGEETATLDDAFTVTP